MQYDYRCPDCNSELTIERSVSTRIPEILLALIVT
jgi:transposase-like protein